MKKKVLNLYAGIGGNRKLWTDCEVTAVEYNSDIAAIYKDFFPQDDVIVGDAHDYLLKHYKEFDFIWTSPPCPTHSRARFWGLNVGSYLPVYPDMKLWQEIIFLKHHATSKWVVENVTPYYQPLIEPQKIGRHLFWANFSVGDVKTPEFKKDSFEYLQKLHGFNIEKYKLKNRVQVLRNCVHPQIGEYVFNRAMGILSAENTEQLKLAI